MRFIPPLVVAALVAAAQPPVDEAKLASARAAHADTQTLNDAIDALETRQRARAHERRRLEQRKNEGAAHAAAISNKTEALWAELTKTKDLGDGGALRPRERGPDALTWARDALKDAAAASKRLQGDRKAYLEAAQADLELLNRTVYPSLRAGARRHRPQLERRAGAPEGAARGPRQVEDRLAARPGQELPAVAGAVGRGELDGVPGRLQRVRADPVRVSVPAHYDLFLAASCFFSCLLAPSRPVVCPTAYLDGLLPSGLAIDLTRERLTAVPEGWAAGRAHVRYDEARRRPAATVRHRRESNAGAAPRTWRSRAGSGASAPRTLGALRGLGDRRAEPGAKALAIATCERVLTSSSGGSTRSTSTADWRAPGHENCKRPRSRSGCLGLWPCLWKHVAVCLGGEAGVAGAGVALAGRVLCVGVAGAGARAGAVGGPCRMRRIGVGVCVCQTMLMASVTIVVALPGTYKSRPSNGAMSPRTCR